MSPTATTATTMLITVISMSKRTGLSGTSKPSIAAKCMSQIAPPPMENAAMPSQRLRRPRVRASRARAVQSSPKNEPRKASR